MQEDLIAPNRHHQSKADVNSVKKQSILVHSVNEVVDVLVLIFTPCTTFTASSPHQ